MASYHDVIEGLKIISKYDPDGPNNYNGVDAQHDVIYAGPYLKFVSDDDDNYDDTLNMPEEDEKQLESLGWYKDRSVGSWACFT